MNVVHSSCVKTYSSVSLLGIRGLHTSHLSAAKDEDVTPPQSNVYIPHIPASLAKPTVAFFGHKHRLKALLDIIFSPRTPQDTQEDRDEYQKRWEAYHSRRKNDEQRYSNHERKSNFRMMNAIRNLPADLYEEAIQSESVPLPSALQYHTMYRTQLLQSEYTNVRRLELLQIFQNLSKTRFPHIHIKRRNPNIFWLPQSKALTRQKEASAKRKTK